MANLDTSVLSCRVTDEIVNMPKRETKEWFLSCVAPAWLLIKAWSGSVLVCSFPLERLLGWARLICSASGRTETQKNHFCFLCRVAFQNSISFKCAWLHDLVSLSPPRVEVCGTGPGQWITEGLRVREWPVLWNFTSLGFEEFGVASVLSNLVSHCHFLLLLASLKMLWAP